MCCKKYGQIIEESASLGHEIASHRIEENVACLAPTRRLRHVVARSSQAPEGSEAHLGSECHSGGWQGLPRDCLILA